MNSHSITMLGTGLIGDFYTMTLHGQRGRDGVPAHGLAHRRAHHGRGRFLDRRDRFGRGCLLAWRWRVA